MGMLEPVFGDWMSYFHVNQLRLEKKCWNLANSSTEVEFHLHTLYDDYTSRWIVGG